MSTLQLRAVSATKADIFQHHKELTHVEEEKNQPTIKPHTLTTTHQLLDFMMKKKYVTVNLHYSRQFFVVWKWYNKKIITLKGQALTGAVVGSNKHINSKQKESIKMSVCPDEILPV